MKEFEVHDNNGNVEYTIAPAQTERFKKTPSKSLTSLLDKTYRDAVIAQSIISPKCVTEDGIYVDPYGDIFPCCWLGGDYLEQPIKEVLPIHKLRNLSVENTKQVLKDVGVPNCKDSVLSNDGNLFEKLSKYWQDDNKCMTCSRQCSNLMYESNNKYE
tara:strand:- start:166 stop:639 length:474 start_codon:yes stop_codon:yes gene_type:complete